MEKKNENQLKPLNKTLFDNVSVEQLEQMLDSGDSQQTQLRIEPISTSCPLDFSDEAGSLTSTATGCSMDLSCMMDCSCMSDCVTNCTADACAIGDICSQCGTQCYVDFGSCGSDCFMASS